MSASTRVLSTYELLEAILCQLPQIEDLLLAQSVSRVWRSVILRSKLLRRKMWYPESQPSAQPLEQCLPQLSIYSISQRRINPMLNRLGSIQIKENDQWHERPQWCIVNSQSEPIYPSLGPWCGMLATNPACKYMQFEFLGSYGETIHRYLVESTSGGLLLGEVIAVLQEAEVRQRYGIDPGGSHKVYFYPIDIPNDPPPGVVGLVPRAQGRERPGDLDNAKRLLQKMDSEVAVKVVAGQGLLYTTPAFSLKRRKSSREGKVYHSAVGYSVCLGVESM